MKKGQGKKKTIKYISIMLVMVLVTGTLSGCSLMKPTTESVLRQYAKQMSSMNTAEMTMRMEMGMKFSQSEVPLNIDVNADSDLQYVREDQDHFKGHTDTKINFNMFGISRSMKSESYIVGDQGEVTLYTRQENEKEWRKSQNMNFIMFDSNAENLAKLLTLQEDTVMEESRECYVLTGEVTGKDIQISDDLGLDFDIDDIKMYETLKVDKQDKTPVSLTITADEDSFNNYIKEILGDQYGDVDAKIDNFEITLKVDSINKEMTIDIPDEVYDAKESDKDGALFSLPMRK